MRALLLVLSLAVARLTAAAEEPDTVATRFVDGCIQLVDAFDRKKEVDLSFEAGLCLGLVKGSLNALAGKPPAPSGPCVPADPDPMAVVRKIVAIYIEHPKFKNESPQVFAMAAVVLVYQCPAAD